MEEDDKGCPIIRMGVSGCMFLLVPACQNVVPQYVLTFIDFRPALCFIPVYIGGLTVRNKRICYVMLCYILCLQCFDTVGWAAGRASGL